MDSQTNISIAVIISIISVSITIINFFTASKRTSKTDAEKETGQITTLIVKIENLMDAITEMKQDLKSMNQDYQDVYKKVIILEQSVSTLHARVDNLDNSVSYKRKKQEK